MMYASLPFPLFTAACYSDILVHKVTLSWVLVPNLDTEFACA